MFRTSHGRPRNRVPNRTGAACYPRAQTVCKRALPQPLPIPDVMTLKTLADVQELMRHLPADSRARLTWLQVAADVEEAAAGGDLEGAVIGLRMVLFLERVECRPQ